MPEAAFTTNNLQALAYTCHIRLLRHSIPLCQSIEPNTPSCLRWVKDVAGYLALTKPTAPHVGSLLNEFGILLFHTRHQACFSSFWVAWLDVEA
jgi:hypothetical protein